MATERFGKVLAALRIEQSPLSAAPSVPKGTVGYVQDFADGHYFVDFDAPYGVVCCAENEIR